MCHKICEHSTVLARHGRQTAAEATQLECQTGAHAIAGKDIYEEHTGRAADQCAVAEFHQCVRRSSPQCASATCAVHKVGQDWQGHKVQICAEEAEPATLPQSTHHTLALAPTGGLLLFFSSQLSTFAPGGGERTAVACVLYSTRVPAAVLRR